MSVRSRSFLGLESNCEFWWTDMSAYFSVLWERNGAVLIHFGIFIISEAVSRCRPKWRLAQQFVREMQPNIVKCDFRLRTCSKGLPSRFQWDCPMSPIEKSRKLDPFREDRLTWRTLGQRSIAPTMFIHLLRRFAYSCRLRVENMKMRALDGTCSWNVYRSGIANSFEAEAWSQIQKMQWEAL